MDGREGKEKGKKITYGLTGRGKKSKRPRVRTGN